MQIKTKTKNSDQTFNVATEWKIETKTKNSATYLVPGPVVLNKERNATVRIKKGARYYSIWLSYGTIDGAPDAERGAFDECLKQAEQELFKPGDEPRYGPLYQLFMVTPELPAHAKCYSFGLKRASFVGVTKEFTERFLNIVTQAYAKALALYIQRHGDWTDEQWMQFNLRRSWPQEKDALGEKAPHSTVNVEGTRIKRINEE